MTIADLKEMIADAPDDMEVLLPGSAVFDGFLKQPCPEESGIIEMPDIPDEDIEKVMESDPEDFDDELYPKKKVFLLAHHGFSEHPEGVPPELN